MSSCSVRDVGSLKNSPSDSRSMDQLSVTTAPPPRSAKNTNSQCASLAETHAAQSEPHGCCHSNHICSNDGLKPISWLGPRGDVSDSTVLSQSSMFWILIGTVSPSASETASLL